MTLRRELEGSSAAAANTASDGRPPSVPLGFSAAELMLLRGEAHGLHGLDGAPYMRGPILYSDDEDNDSFYSGVSVFSVLYH
jgi:hypothetical protein